RGHDWAMQIWHQSVSTRGTVVETYLRSRRLELPPECDEKVLRFHAHLKLAGGGYAPGMVALFRNIETNEPQAIHRTFLTPDGRKQVRKMLGPVRGAAIKLCGAVDDHLTIGEGVETCLAAILAGFRPCWAVGSGGAIGSFPTIGLVMSLTVLGEVN